MTDKPEAPLQLLIVMIALSSLSILAFVMSQSPTFRGPLFGSGVVMAITATGGSAWMTIRTRQWKSAAIAVLSLLPLVFWSRQMDLAFHT